MLRHRPRIFSGKQASVTDHRTQSTPNKQSHTTRPTPSFLFSRFGNIITIICNKPKPMWTSRPGIPLNITPFSISASKIIPFWHDKFPSRQNPKTTPERKLSMQNKFLPLGISHALAEHTDAVLFNSKLRAKFRESIRLLPPDIRIENQDAKCYSVSESRISLEDMEASEDYTCVIHHGPNTTTTHIFDDCIVESYCCSISNDKSPPKSNSPGYFLSSCYTCKKDLQQTQDIYIYRGEKAFCSSECRFKEMMLDAENTEAEDSFPGT